MGRGQDLEQQQKDTQTDQEIEIKRGDNCTEGEKRGPTKWKKGDSWTGRDESSAQNRGTWGEKKNL